MSYDQDIVSFTGYVETTFQALTVIHAAKQSIIDIPRLTRQLNDAKRTAIRSGAIFVFRVDEANRIQWIDGLHWSPPQMLGDFLEYRQIENFWNARTSTRGALMKKSISVTIEGSILQLIAYYTPEDIRPGKLMLPTPRPAVMSLDMAPCIFCPTNSMIPTNTLYGSPEVESNRVSGSRTLKWSTDISPAPDGHNRDLPRFPEIPLARGWTHQETSKAVSSSQLHGQADRDAQSCFIHDGQKGAVEDHESNSEAPKVRRRRRRSRKSRLVREGAEMWQDNEVRVQPSGSGVQPFGNFPVQPWAYYPPAFMIAMPVTVVPFAPIMAGSSGLTVTNVAGNVTNVQMYDNNSTNVRVNKGTKERKGGNSDR